MQAAKEEAAGTTTNSAPEPAAPVDPIRAREHFTQGRRLIFGSRAKMNYETFDYDVLDEGLAELEQAAALSPADAEIAFWAGRGWQVRHDQAKALPHLQRAAELRPKHADTWRWMGVALLRTGEEEAGAAALQRALELGAEDYGRFLELGKLDERDQRWADARGHYEQAIAAAPLEPLPHFRLGSILFRMQDTEEAELAMARFDELNKAERKLEAAFDRLRAQQRDPQAQLGVAAAFLAARDHEEALAWLDRVLAVHPDDPVVHLYRGRALRGLDRLDEAVEHLETAARLAPSSPEPWRELAKVLGERGDPRAGLEAARKGAALAPEDPASPCSVGLAHAAAGDPAAARESFLAALALDAGHLPALLGLADALAALGKTEAAVARYEDVLRLEPRQLQARLGLRALRDEEP